MMQTIHHTAISTGNLDRLVRFYRDLLGFEVEREFAWAQGTEVADRVVGLRDSAARAVMLRLGDSRLELFEFSSPEPEAGDARRPVCDHGITHLALTVADIDAEHRRLASSGMVFHCPPQSLETSKVTYGRDPDGNVIELMELAAT